MQSKRTITAAVARHYQTSSSKAEKTRMLDEFIRITGYNRSYAGRLLRTWKPVRSARRKRPGRTVYGDDVRIALEKIWAVLDYVCGKRLTAALPDVLKRLTLFGEISVTREVRKKLLRISPATADRLLAQARRNRGRTKKRTRNPNACLFDRIPIKTFGEWKQPIVGQLEVDLVAHNGGDVSGGHIWTMNAVDVATGWTGCGETCNRYGSGANDKKWFT